ncbi:MAG: YdcF family protein [Gallionella sp.]
MNWFTTNLISSLLSPPFSLLILALIGFLMFFRHPKAAKALIFIAFALLWLASTPYLAEGSLHLLEAKTAALKTTPQGTAAIVILGGGTYFKAPEYSGADTISDATLVRLRYGARLARESKLPILVTGGKPLGNAVSEAKQMKITLEEDFRVPVRWTEGASDNTFENAQYSYATLQKAGISKIYLVTHSWHMARSATAFKSAGFEVIEAPTAFTTRYQLDALAFVPRAEALRDSKIFVHEVIGLLWYQAKSLITQNIRN